jgi:hypothetical protein
MGLSGAGFALSAGLRIASLDRGSTNPAQLIATSPITSRDGINAIDLRYGIATSLH